MCEETKDQVLVFDQIDGNLESYCKYEVLLGEHVVLEELKLVPNSSQSHQEFLIKHAYWFISRPFLFESSWLQNIGGVNKISIFLNKSHFCEQQFWILKDESGWVCGSVYVRISAQSIDMNVLPLFTQLFKQFFKGAIVDSRTIKHGSVADCEHFQGNEYQEFVKSSNRFHEFKWGKLTMINHQNCKISKYLLPRCLFCQLAIMGDPIAHFCLYLLVWAQNWQTIKLSLFILPWCQNLLRLFCLISLSQLLFAVFWIPQEITLITGVNSIRNGSLILLLSHPIIDHLLFQLWFLFALHEWVENWPEFVGTNPTCRIDSQSSLQQSLHSFGKLVILRQFIPAVGLF